MNTVVQLFPDNRQSEPPVREVFSNVMSNKKTGCYLTHRSLYKNDWADDVYVLALFHRMLSQAASKPTTVCFHDRQWDLDRGELVIVPSEIGLRMKDRNKKPTSRDAVVRMLKLLERENVISTHGTDKGTVVKFINYDAYQTLNGSNQGAQLPAQPAAQLPAQHKPSNGAACAADAAQLPAQPAVHLPAQEEQITINNIKQDQDLKIYGPRTADAIPDPERDEQKIPSEAAICEKRGKSQKWGTPDDLICARWLASRRAKAYTDKELPPPKEPNLAGWANDVRLMRTADGRTHSEICHLFAWVCKEGRELEFCQAPSKLREKWDSLQLKKTNLERGVTGNKKPLSNIAAAQQAARASGVTYDPNEPL